MGVPAVPWHARIPQSLDGRALHVGKEGAEAEEEVDGDDAEPNEAALPALGEAQECYGEGGLAPCGGCYGADAGYVGHEEVGRPVRYVPAMFAEAVMHADGKHRGLSDQSPLRLC